MKFLFFYRLLSPERNINLGFIGPLLKIKGEPFLLFFTILRDNLQFPIVDLLDVDKPNNLSLAH
jgi:hypothetical protein